jgi:opacity protein-like surface antigen
LNGLRQDSILERMGDYPKLKGALLHIGLLLLFSTNLPAQNTLEHVTFGAGGGFTFPVGQLSNRTQTVGYEFAASGGPRFNPSLSLTLDFAIHYINLKNRLQQVSTATDFSLGSTVRIWSLTVNPTYQFIRREKTSYYATAGYGLYNRQLQIPFPGPFAVAGCDPYWGVCVGNSPAAGTITGNLDRYMGGYNVGGGVNFGRRTKLFVEVRYHHMFTSNSPTELIPITVGVRW